MMRFELPLALALALVGAAGCDRTPEEAPPPEGGVLTGIATVKGPVDRSKAEKIALFYAQVHWPSYRPNLATGFNTGDGEYRVVVGFDKRPDAASVFVRIADGEVVDASIARPATSEFNPPHESIFQ